MKKVVLISGVSSGIGNATAKLFTQKGWHVIGVSRSDVSKIEGVGHYIKGDVSIVSDVDHIFDEIRSDEGRIDVLINNAAVQICKPIVEMNVDEWNKTMDTNLRSAFLFIKHSYSLMRERGGSIINVSSVHAISTSSNIAAYAASKGALAAFTRALAIELAPDNIRVNAVLPGAVDTPMLRSGLQREHVVGSNIEERIECLAKKHIMGRIGKPDEIARAILFLSDEAASTSFITGHCLVIDGGATIKLSTE
ncbi:short-chain dehydrogenase [Methanosarcina sp. 2.H.T.1A.6]|uniref:SDR family NAD(P)-dependent oxidoreductase n=1 Tax=unclassified Methanosarcina TaxID=2644672 RepID=UPI000621CA86|nr:MULTISPECIES: SDR family oxidoreductase [unclassified Methanosarcina]KKG09822.1 short-chain dehydrogenase [Methanosarcina sp. 2.H.T.1A.15]KKG14912.1 short-chain dehydrogenase [Methanosarcina sp. 2.H.T.1A.3]KKG21038.1 short-chain dehydrogenase [Methanosarcina sp. 2.H.T.1A.6]KKG27287.1 short-chain dehydrogenase [Methanosarcina sp. 2.H.T.1A.8]